MDAISAALVRLLFWTMRCLPVRVCGALGACLGRLGFYIDARHRKVALRNLARVCPERDRSWRRRVARESFAELGRTAFELPHVFLRSKKFLLSRVVVEGEETFRSAMEEGNGVFLCACHHGNWELGALMFSLLGYDSTIIYRPLRQKSLENYLKQCRQRFNATMQSRHEGLRWLPRTLSRGESVAVMIDQHQANGIPIPFIGHLASTTTLPAALSIKQGIPIFGVAIRRMGRDFRFRLCFWPVMFPEASGNRDADVYHMMQNINHDFEAIIHERPELWLWSHRRWRILEQDHRISEVVYGTP